MLFWPWLGPPMTALRSIMYFGFTDDVMFSTLTNAQALLQKLETAATTVSLTINQSKTKAMIIGDKPTGEQILLKTGNIDVVDDFCYLGSWVAMSSRDINIRKAQAWTAINKLWRIWKAPQLSRELKIRIFEPPLKPYYFMAISAGLCCTRTFT